MRVLLARAYRAMSGRHRLAAGHNRSARRSSGPGRAGCSFMEPLECRQLLSTFYVSPSGSDSHSGTSTTSAWKTIARVNQQTIHAGDKILFQGGQSFSGSLYFPSAEGGTSTNPVTIATYGTGRATIKSGSSNAINVAQIAGFDIRNLNLIGSGASYNKSDGIFFHCDWTNRKLNRIHIDSVSVTGYGGYGIMVKAVGSGSGYNDVRITNVDAHDNSSGVGMWASGGHLNSNTYVGHVRAWNNAGDGSTSHVSGSGIYISNVEGGIIERCVAWNNGTRGAAPVGIWSAGFNRMTIQYNESYNNHTKTSTDGGGFDLDWSTTNSTVQYNYSHGNDGPGYLVAAGTHATSGNVFRYNVSENDARKNGKAAIQLWGSVANTSIYGNTVYMSNTYNSASSAIQLHNAGVSTTRMSNVQVRNNIFYTTGGVKLVNVSSDVLSRSSGISFLGNAYHAGGSTFKISWGNNSYGSLSSWQSSKGQEMSSGVRKGYQGDPKLVYAGHGGTLGNADRLNTLTAYRLQSASPLINRGVSLPSTLSSTPKDYWGDALPKSGVYDIGADEAG